MSDDLEQRLRAADPARFPDVYAADPAFIDRLTEATMTSTTDTGTSRSRRRPLALAAGTVAVLGVGAALAFGGPGSQDSPPEGSTLRLALPSSTMTSSCLAYSVGILAGMPIAFSGEAVDVTDETVTVRVDRWYRGGDASTVVLAAPRQERVALDGLESFEDGERYLVTASEDGAVNGCGYSGPWTESGAADFDKAFAE